MKEIKLGEIFTVEGKMYLIQQTKGYNQPMYLLIPVQTNTGT